MFCYLLGMLMRDGLHLEDSLIASFVLCGRQAHDIALAHHLDPGSNGYTFGSDRYHRATELVSPILEDFDFRLKRQGGGLVAERDGLQLQFATARGVDLRNKSHFDMGASPARHRAASANTFVQEAIPGMYAGLSLGVLHVIWSGDVESGLTAVYLGKLNSPSAQHLDWEDLVRIDSDGQTMQLDDISSAELTVLSYDEQPVPIFELGLLEQMKSSEN